MSYILDALKKSERQRRMGEVPQIYSPVESPPPDPARRNWWIPVAVFAISANIAVAGWLWWQYGRGQPAPAAGPSSVLATADSALAGPGSMLAAPGSMSATPGSTLPTPASMPAAPPTIRATPAPAAGPAAGPLAAMVPRPPQAAPAPHRVAAPPVAPGPGPVPSAPPARRPVPAQPNPDLDRVVVFDPADTDRRRPQQLDAPVDNLVTIEALPHQLGLQMLALTVNAHVWDEQADRRFVLIDMKRYSEGHALPQGPIIERITRDGLLMSYQGLHFKINRN